MTAPPPKTTLLLTGATGFIGSWVLPMITAEKSFNVIITGRKNYQPSDASYLRIDLRDKNAVDASRESLKHVDVLVHVAASMPVQSNASDLFLDNIHLTLNLLSVLSQTVKTIIFVSSVDVYGMPQSMPVRENHPENPTSFYGAGKLAVEKYLQIFCARHSIRLAILRLSHVYGPREPIIKAIPTFVTRILNGQPPLILGEGREKRDYLYVEDAARAILLACQRRACGIFNIASGQEHSIRETAERIIRLSGRPLQLLFTESHLAGYDMLPDITKAKNALGFFPNITFDEGLQRTLKYFENR